MRLVSPLLIAAAMALPTAQFAHAETALIAVTGDATIAVTPDLALISLGATTTAETAAEAMAANSAAMTVIIENLRSAGVADGDIQTSMLQVNPNFSSSESKLSSDMGRYIAVNQVTVRLRALENLGTILDAAVSDGVNTLNGISFDLADKRPVQDQARMAAVKDAIARATLLAQAAGVGLGKITSITEGGAAAGPAPMYRMDAASVPVAAGELEISQSVTVTFEITP